MSITPYFAWPEVLTVQASPTPTSTVFTVDDAGTLVEGQYILVADGLFDWERAQILSLAGNAVTLTAAMAQGAPAAGAEVRNGRKLVKNGDLDASALFNAEDEAELEGVDTTYADTGLKYQISGQIWYFDKSSAASAGPDVLVPTAGPGRWLRLSVPVLPSLLGGRSLLVDSQHPDAVAGNTDPAYPFYTLMDAHAVIAWNHPVVLIPATTVFTNEDNYSHLVITKSSTWLGLGQVTLQTLGPTTDAPTIQADNKTVRMDDITFSTEDFSTPSPTPGLLAEAYDGGAYLEFNRCQFITNVSASYGFHAKLMEAGAFFEMTFNECVFDNTAFMAGGFRLEEISGTPGTGVITFNRCTFNRLPHFMARNHTIILNECRILMTATSVAWQGTIELNGGSITSTTAPAVTSRASQTLNLKARNVEFKSDAIGGEYLTMGAGSTFTFERQNCTVTGTATAINAGITVTTHDTGGSLADNSVTMAKLADLAANSLIGNPTGSTADPQAITCTAAGRALIDDADAAAQRVTLGYNPVTALFPRPALTDGTDNTQAYSVATTAARFWRVQVPSEIVVNKITLTVGNVTTAATLKIALYSAADGSKLFEVTTASIGTPSTAYTTDVSAVRLLPGDYYFGIVPVSGAINHTAYVWGMNSNFPLAPAGKAAFAFAKTVTAGTLPPTITPTSETDVSAASPIAFRLDN